MQEQLNTLVEKIKEDYYNWQGLSLDQEPHRVKVREDMIENFNNSIDIHEGKKYIKIVCDRTVWGFVVNVDNDKKFRKGDILKAAGYNAPARNFARGNILDSGYTIKWPGA